jgi:hypothetical protein
LKFYVRGLKNLQTLVLVELFCTIVQIQPKELLSSFFDDEMFRFEPPISTISGGIKCLRVIVDGLLSIDPQKIKEASALIQCIKCITHRSSTLDQAACKAVIDWIFSIKDNLPDEAHFQNCCIVSIYFKIFYSDTLIRMQFSLCLGSVLLRKT